MRMVIGADHGNGHFKGVSNVKEILYPSVFSRSDGEESISYVGEQKTSELYELTSKSYEFEKYVWGSDIYRVPNLLSTYDADSSRYLSKEYRLLSEFALALLTSDEGNMFADLLVVTGCPSREKGTQQEDEIIKAYEGAHIVTVNGQQKIINVKDVIVLPQPLGTVLYLYLDHEGYVADKTYETSYVGVIDIGSGTTDLDGIKALKRQTDDMETVRIGMFDAYREIANDLNKFNPNLHATPQEVEHQINQDSYRKSDRAIIPSETYKKIKREAFERLGQEIVANARSVWKDRSKFDKILLTGGGAASKYIAKSLKEFEQDIQVVENSQMANAIGFYRYGRFKSLEV